MLGLPDEEGNAENSVGNDSTSSVFFTLRMRDEIIAYHRATDAALAAAVSQARREGSVEKVPETGIGAHRREVYIFPQEDDPAAAILGCKIQPLQHRCRLIQRDINRRNPVGAEEMSLSNFDEPVQNLACACPVAGLCQPIGEVCPSQRALVGLLNG